MSSSLQILSSMRRGGGGGERNLKDSDSDIAAGGRPGGDIELGGAGGSGPSGSLHGAKAGAGSTRPRASASVKQHQQAQQQQQREREMRPLLSSSINNSAHAPSSASAAGRNPIMSAIGIAPPQGFRDTGDHIGYVGGGHDRRDVSGKKFRVQVPKKFIFWFLVVFLALPIFLFTYILWTRIFKGKAAGAGHYHHNAPAMDTVHQTGGGIRGGDDPPLLPPGVGVSGDSDANEQDLSNIEFPAEQDSAEQSNQSQRDGAEPGTGGGAEVVAEDDPPSVPKAVEPPETTKEVGEEESAGATASEIVDAAAIETGEGVGDAAGTGDGDGQRQQDPEAAAVDAPPPQQAEQEQQQSSAAGGEAEARAEDLTAEKSKTTDEQPNADDAEKHTPATQDQDEDGGAKVDGKEPTAENVTEGNQEGDSAGGDDGGDAGGDDEEKVVDGQ